MNSAKLLSRILPAAMKEPLSERLDATSHRIKLITERVAAEDTVLDIGCVRHTLENQEWKEPQPGEFLHADLCRTADRVVGLDLVESDVKRMIDAGYEVQVGNAETFSIDEKFDVIVAGELVEHLSNPGLFLRRCRQHLAEDGKVIITTPNPRRFHMLLWYALGRHENANQEHTLWFDHYVFEELARREGYEMTDWEYYRPGYAATTMALCAVGPKALGAGGFVFELQPAED